MSNKEETMVIAFRRRLRGVTLRAFALSMLAAAAIAATTPPPAKANYTVSECVPTAGIGAPDFFMERPFPSGNFKIAQADNCGAGGWGLRMEPNGQTNNTLWVAWRINAAPATRFAKAQSLIHYSSGGGYGTMGEGDGGSPGYSSVGGGGHHWVTHVQNNTSYYRIYEQCFAAPCNSTTAFAYITSFYAEVEDLVAPSVSATGALLDGGVISGVQTINATATDSGGGAQSVLVYVNGIESARTANFCNPQAGVYHSVKPCPDAPGSRALALDTEHGAGWVNGANDVQICAYDVGGNQSPCVRKTVHVDNSCPGSGGGAAATLKGGADVRGDLRQRAQLTSNEEPVIRGALTNSAGDPVSGASVCVYETVNLPDAGRELAAVVTTQPNGRFATKLDSGASRSIDLVYRYNTGKLSDRVELDSRVVPTLAVPKRNLRNGHAAKFLGVLPGPNAEGRAVALQVRAGRKWRTFKQLRTRAGGGFKGKYRFTNTSGRQLYSFRALVKRQSGYPYDPGASRKRKLIVRG